MSRSGYSKITERFSWGGSKGPATPQTPATTGGSINSAARDSKMIPLDMESITRNPYGAAKGCVEGMIPFFHDAYIRYTVISEYLTPWRLGLLNQAFFGLLLCFFGGSYMTLIAAVEAYRLNGWDVQVKLVNELITDFNKFRIANERDDVEDLDKDGIPDVEQIDTKALAQRKALLFFRTIDPNHFGDIIGGLQSGLFAVIAVLKFQFAKAITLGTVIQQMLKKPVDMFITPLLTAQMPAEYRDWAPVGLGWVVKAIAIWVAFFVQRVISAYYSAMRGGLMAARNVLEYCSKMGFFSINPEDTIIDEVAGYSLAAIGLYWQVSAGFQLYFPLNLLLLPATMAEWALLWLINSP